MSHNRNHAMTAGVALPDHSVLTMKGADAVAFAQAQFMNDVSALADGQWQWNGWLTPKGRVIALFALLRLDAQTLWLLLPDFAAAELATLLQRYVFRSKVILTALDMTVSGDFNAPGSATGASFAINDAEDGNVNRNGEHDRWIELDMGAEGGPRSLRIGGMPGREAAEAATRWNQADLAHGLPRLPASQRETWTPQQLSLDRLRAFSVKKGCYPGQEIIARTHYLGKAKRGLALFETTSEVTAGSDVHAAGRSIGNVASASGGVALAVLPLDVPTADLSVAGVTLQPRTLLDGLAR